LFLIQLTKNLTLQTSPTLLLLVISVYLFSVPSSTGSWPMCWTLWDALRIMVACNATFRLFGVFAMGISNDLWIETLILTDFSQVFALRPH
jgi:hypothetical protein